MLARILELENLEAEGRLNEELRKERNDVKTSLIMQSLKRRLCGDRKVKIQSAKAFQRGGYELKVFSPDSERKNGKKFDQQIGNRGRLFYGR